MNGAQAKRIVLGGAAATGAVAGVRSLTTGQVPSLRILIGALLTAAVLAMLADFQPNLAVAFALVILIGAAIGAGPDTWRAITDATRGGSAAPATPSSSGQSGFDPAHGRAGGGAGGGGGGSW